jgi:GNAT superfamily N-acetyltransferase
MTATYRIQIRFGLSGIFKEEQMNTISLRLNSLIIEGGNLCLRELRQDDYERLVEIVRDYSINSTVLLYGLYRKNRDWVTSTMRENDLDKVLDIFDTKVNGDDITVDCRSLKEDLNNCSDELLFSPYGPIQAPFRISVKNYIGKALQERQEPERKVFRMGIDYQGTLIGVFTFDVIECVIQDCRTIGDIGVFIDPAYRNHWSGTLYYVAYLMHHVLGFQDKSQNLYISATTHPLNSETRGLSIAGQEEKRCLLDPSYGWREKTPISSSYGKRRIFVAEYIKYIQEGLLCSKLKRPLRITIIAEE